MDLPELICKVVGHNWEFPRCVRCKRVQIVHVYVNGLLQVPSQDYIEDGEGRITLTHSPSDGNVVSVTVGQQDGLWGRNDFIVSGGTVTFTVHSYY